MGPGLLFNLNLDSRQQTSHDRFLPFAVQFGSIREASTMTAVRSSQHPATVYTMSLSLIVLLLSLFAVDAGDLGECGYIQEACEESWNNEPPVPYCIACISVIQQYWESYNCEPNATTALSGLCNATASNDNITETYVECATQQVFENCERDKTKRGAILCFTLIWGGMVLFMILICLRRSRLFRFSFSRTMIDDGPLEKSNTSQKVPPDTEKRDTGNNADSGDDADEKDSESQSDV